MRGGPKTGITPAAVLTVLVLAGCSAMFTEEEEVYRGLYVEDVVAMSRAGVPPGIIIRKIEVSGSRFSLDKEGLISLRRKGVSDEVVEAMMNTSDEAKEADLERGYALYEYWTNYYNRFYPSVLPFYRFFPSMYYAYGPLHTARYRWSGIMGAYYLDFPVGFHRRYREVYPLMVGRGADTGRAGISAETEADRGER